jgi:hypothetical protein
MSEPRDFTSEIADALVAGDLKALAKVAMELNAIAMAGELARHKAAERQRRRRERLANEAERASSHVTSRDVTLSHVTDVTPPSPLPSLLSPTPPYNSSFPPPPRSANGAHEVDDEKLRALVGDAGWPDVARFLDKRRADKRGEWRREMAKVIGPGSQFTGDDLAGACSDALIVDLDGPHALRAFVAKRREERLNPPAERKQGQRRTGESDGSFADRRAAEEREKADEKRRADRGRQYDAARTKAVADWQAANVDAFERIKAELLGTVGFKADSPAFAACLAVKVASVIGFPAEEHWTPGRSIAPVVDPYAAPPNDDAARVAAEQREIAAAYHEQLDAHVERWRKTHEREYREHANAVFTQFGYARNQRLTHDQQIAVNNAINLRIRDEQEWSTQPVWVEKEQRRRRVAVAS